MKFLPIFLTIALLSACRNTEKPQNTLLDSTHIYPTISYLKIKLDSERHLPANPYIMEFKNGKKQVVFCGVNHLKDDSDIKNPMFDTIEKKFFAFRPELCINEGGDISQKIYSSKNDALLKDGEIGLVKILADSLKVKAINGDISDSLEFRQLLKKYTKGEFLAYIVTERLMWGLRGANILKHDEIENKFNGFIKDYIMEKGKVSLNPEERSFAFYKSNYQKLLNIPFDIEELEPTDPFNPKGKFQEIGRTSKEIRDQFLLKTIDKLLDSHDKIFIVFGGWHLLTCEPGLKEIINRKR